MFMNKEALVDSVVCYRCGAPSIPIVYGFPSGSMVRDAARGKIALGGCVITSIDAQWKFSADCDDKNSGKKIN